MPRFCSSRLFRTVPSVASSVAGVGFLGILFSIPCLGAVPVTITPSDHGALVTAGGQPFAEYHERSGYQPAIWPIIGPGGQAYTRSYPTGPFVEGETNDHPHHRSLWFTHGNVNGADFWSEFTDSSQQESADRPVIAHRSFEVMESRGDTAVLIAHNDWLHHKTKVCEDTRTIRFGADESLRWIDFQVELKASNGEVTFGETKEGTFGIRVADTMRVDAKMGGQIFNSRGQRDERAWGQPAQWVTYSGPIGGETAAITVCNHPSSLRYPTRWHVRTYGLFAANPFGESEFPPAETKQGEFTLPPGESMRLRYLVLLHQGELSAEVIQQYIQQFAAEE